jgi:hypothetical protein
MTQKVFYECGGEPTELGTVITREEFIRLDPGEVYDNLMCCGDEAIIFRHVEGGHVAVEAGGSVWLEEAQEPQRPSRGLF